MRTRDLKPGFFRDKDLAKLPFVVRYCYAGLWCVSDRKGRLEDNIKTIDAEVFPWDKVPVEKYLQALAAGGFIQRYEVDGARYIWIPKFRDHQKPHPNEADSVLPPSPLEECYEGKKPLIPPGDP